MRKLNIKRPGTRIWTPALLPLILIVLVSSITAQNNSQEVLSLIQSTLDSTGAPAISAAVAVEGTIIFSEGAGFADIENKVVATGKTVYRIASISKPISAIGMMQLYEQENVNLDDPIQKYVPSFPEKRWKITLKHILTHTSGIRHYNRGEFGIMEHFDSLAVAIKIFKDDTLRFEPGTKYLYTTFGFNLIQGVIETASGMGINDYMHEKVWSPAGMNNTYFERPGEIVDNRARGYDRSRNRQIRNASYTDVSIKYVGGGIISTAEDLVRVFIALDSGVLLKPETVRLMYTIHFERRENSGRGLGWIVETDSAGRKKVSHSGSSTGFRSMLINYPDEKIVVAVITNQSFFRPNRLAQKIADIYLPIR